MYGVQTNTSIQKYNFVRKLYMIYILSLLKGMDEEAYKEMWISGELDEQEKQFIAFDISIQRSFAVFVSGVRGFFWFLAC